MSVEDPTGRVELSADDKKYEAFIKEAEQSEFWRANLPGLTDVTTGSLVMNLIDHGIFDIKVDTVEGLYREYEEKLEKKQSKE